MKKKTLNFIILPIILLLVFSGCTSDNPEDFASESFVPEGFVYVKDVIKTAQIDMRYYGNNNFVGTRIDGYEAPVAILTEKAAAALKIAADLLEGQGYYIKIFDAYRPQQAVDHFIRWAADANDIKMKDSFYPDLDKSVLFGLGYIAEKSGHTRGSVVDLTIVSKDTGKEIDMGSGFDFFGEISHHGTNLITTEQEINRNILRDAMIAAGFDPYYKEWWHYQLKNEPYPNEYFNFKVK